jgi:hypothetical protein
MPVFVFFVNPPMGVFIRPLVWYGRFYAGKIHVPAKTKRLWSKSLPMSLTCPTSAGSAIARRNKRVRAGGDKKGQAEGLTFFVARPRTSISLSIAQRELTGKFIEIWNCWGAAILER